MIRQTISILLLVAPLLPVAGCSRSPHQRLKWRAEDFFTDKGVVALCKAIEKKDITEIDRLVKSGVNVNTKCRGNMTPLLWAFSMGENVFKKMLELGADPNVKLTERVLPVAFEPGDSVTIACATHDIIDGLLHDGYLRGVPMDSYLELVLQHGGNPNIVDAKEETPLFRLERSIPSKLPVRARLLVAAGADINHRNRQGVTPLICATREAGYAFCLLKAGADYRLVDNDGWDFVILLQRTKDSRESDLRKYPNNALK